MKIAARKTTAASKAGCAKLVLDSKEDPLHLRPPPSRTAPSSSPRTDKTRTGKCFTCAPFTYRRLQKTNSISKNAFKRRVAARHGKPNNASANPRIAPHLNKRTWPPSLPRHGPSQTGPKMRPYRRPITGRPVPESPDSEITHGGTLRCSHRPIPNGTTQDRETDARKTARGKFRKIKFENGNSGPRKTRSGNPGPL
jgi:hypothetical protein